MKRYFIICLAIIFSIFSVAMAETSETETITFRDFNWFESAAVVEETMKTITNKNYCYRHEHAELSTWYRKYDLLPSEDLSVYDAGVTINFNNVPVAGYNADLKFEFGYNINNDIVDYNSDNAQLCYAQYTIRELNDSEAVYTDLSEKLISLYGVAEENTYKGDIFGDGFKGLVWTAKDGSVAWLALRSSSISDDKITLVYAAPNLDEYLINLNEQIKNFNLNKNANNIDGL